MLLDALKKDKRRGLNSLVIMETIPNKKNAEFLTERLFHRILMVLMTFLILFSMSFAFISVKRSDISTDPIPPNDVADKGIQKPLPEYIVEKIKPDELELLKP